MYILNKNWVISKIQDGRRWLLVSWINQNVSQSSFFFVKKKTKKTMKHINSKGLNSSNFDSVISFRLWYQSNMATGRHFQFHSIFSGSVFFFIWNYVRMFRQNDITAQTKSKTKSFKTTKMATVNVCGNYQEFGTLAAAWRQAAILYQFVWVFKFSSRCRFTSLSPCTQEEADSRIFLRIAPVDSCGHRNIIVRTSDSDGVVLAVSAFVSLNQ